VDIINLVDKLETLIATSATVPLKGSKIVDPNRFMELIDQLRLAVPQDVRSAQELISKKDNLMHQAQSDAHRTRVEAEQEFKNRLEQSEIVTVANAKADDIMGEAQKRASRMVEQAEVEARTKRSEADAYCLQTLKTLEKELSGILVSVKKGVHVLTPPDVSAPSDQ
jgi:cell division septum initiation protein DivIVA